MPGSHITPKRHMRQLWRVYIYIFKVPRTMFWYLIHPRNWRCIFIPMQILRDCGDTKILETLFVIGVELDLWSLYTFFIYCWCQKYRQILLFMYCILGMWNCLVLLEHCFLWKVLSRKCLTTWELIFRSCSFCQDPLSLSKKSVHSCGNKYNNDSYIKSHFCQV